MNKKIVLAASVYLCFMILWSICIAHRFGIYTPVPLSIRPFFVGGWGIGVIAFSLLIGQLSRPHKQ